MPMLGKPGSLFYDLAEAGQAALAHHEANKPRLHDRIAEFLLTRALEPTRDWLRDPAQALQRIVGAVDRHDRLLRVTADADLAPQARGMRLRLRRDGFAPELVGQCFALVREAVTTATGRSSPRRRRTFV